ncbi:MAG TPA: AMP-binding protein [Candidatus Dormibacteraeota bacterium]|nr:AMP-binding protein [Candidatus Dormibacteraeota bacterium]
MSLTTSYWPADTGIPVLETTVGDVLRTVTAERPGQDALIDGTPDPATRRRWTYERLLEDSERVARALLARFSPGERVAVWGPNTTEWVRLEYGAALAGLVLVTVNPAYRPSELRYVLGQSGAAGIFLVPEFRGNLMAESLAGVRSELPELRESILFTDWDGFCASGSPTERLPEVTPDDAAQIQYTSGTTGFPKAALLHHRGITNNALLLTRRMGWEPGDVAVNPFPLFHTAGCVLGVLGAAQSRATLVPVVAFDPGLYLELLETHRATVTLGAPTMLISAMEHPDRPRRDLSALRVVTSGGATVPVELVRNVEAGLGVRFSIIFGQTEASPGITGTHLDDSPEDKAETLGQPLPQTEVKIIDPATGETLPTGAVGELCARGYLVMTGYHNMPEATAEAIDAEGWLHTGDLASMDERGYCRIEGRLKDMIIRGGENIYPREIEELLYTHPAVADVAVVGAPDPRWGEEVAAFVRPAAGAAPTSEELFAFVRAHLAPYKTPKRWIFCDTFPTTPSGKVQKNVLRARLAATAEEAAAPS